MDKAEALRILSERIEALRQIPQYHVEVRVLWDDAEGGNLRVAASIHDGGLRTLRPIRDDFILAPDGSFVGK